MRQRLTVILSFIFLLFITSLPIHAKSYTIDSADITIQINQDGTADAKEIRTYTFDGHYENGEWNIDTAKNKIDLDSIVLLENETEYRRSSVLSPGSYSISSSGDKITVRWKYSADDETGQFTIKYKIINAISNYSDTAEFYWKFIGTGWSVPTGKVTATVFLPYPAPDTHLKAWGHGPLDGKVSIVSPKEIEFSVSPLQPNTFMEGRIVFPSLPGIAVIPQSKLEAIVAEEAGFINQTIADTNQKEINLLPYAIFLSLAGVGFLIRFLYWFKIWLSKGKESKLPEINYSGTLHEPPSSLEPALVESLFTLDFKPTTKSITATLLELCRKKIVKITQQKKVGLLGLFSRDPEILFELKKDTGLSTIEKGVVGLLYLDEKPTITKTEIFAKLRTDTLRQTSWNNWRDKVKQQLLADEYLDKESSRLKSRLSMDVVIGIGAFILLIFALQTINSNSFSPDILIVGVLIELVIYFIGLILLIVSMDKRTPKGALEAAGWKAFKKYLRDYSVTKGYPLDSIIIWEKYLVYGAALGISLKALSQLPLKFASDQKSSYIYAAGLSDKGGLNFDHLGSGLSALGVAYGASGSGSSGGFSGGGGGGGGGSGGGMS